MANARRPCAGPIARGLLVALATACACTTPRRPAHASDDATDVATLVARLSDDAFARRRAAERRLDALGAERLSETEGDAKGAPGAHGAGERDALAALGALVEALDVAAHSDPAAAAAAERILRRLDAACPPARAAAIPTLARRGVRRLAAESVSTRLDEEEERLEARMPRRRGRREFDSYASRIVGALGMDGLRETLRSLLRDARLTAREAAGVVALVGWMGFDRDGDLEAWDALSAFATERRSDATAACGFRTRDGRLPAAYLAAALFLTGRATAGAAFVRTDPDADATALALVRSRLTEVGLADVGFGRFLENLVAEGTRADVAVRASRRALDADVPWVARAWARRALFLDARSHDALEALVRSAEAVGLPATARREAGGDVTVVAPPDAADDPAARAFDAALAQGAVAQRLVAILELGDGDAPGGLACAARPDGVVACGHGNGRVLLEDPGLHGLRTHLSTGVSAPVRALAGTADVWAAVSATGHLVVWNADGEETWPGAGVVRTGTVGSFRALAVAGEALYAVEEHGEVHRVTARGPTRIDAVTASPGPAPHAAYGLGRGALLVLRGAAAQRVDLATGTVVALAVGGPPVVAAPYAEDALVVRGETYERVAPDGTTRWSRPVPEGDRVLGVAGDPRTSRVYLVFADHVLAVAESDGTPRWREEVSGGASPTVHAGYLYVPAGWGTGRVGDVGAERSLFALRTDVGGLDPFDLPALSRLRAAAAAAAAAGDAEVATLLEDPVHGWLPGAR